MVERWLCGEELRVKGEVMVEVVRMEEGEAERREVRVARPVGESAVRRRRREPVVERSGVKDWKRLVRVEDGIFGGVWLEVMVVGVFFGGWVEWRDCGWLLSWREIQLSTRKYF